MTQAIKSGASANQTDADGFAPLHLAAKAAAGEKVMAALVSAQADVNAFAGNGATPLQVAAQSGSIANLRALMQAGANVNLQVLCCERPGRSVCAVHKANSRRGSAFPFRISCGQPSFVGHECALHVCASPYSAMRRGLQRPRTSRGHPGIIQASSRRHPEGSSSLLFSAIIHHFSIQDNRKGKSALHHAAAAGHKESCLLLLSSNAEVNLPDSDGERALHHAARFGDVGVIQAVLSYGADVHVADLEGWAPLHEAARWGDGPAVEALLERGADPNVRSNDGETPFHVVFFTILWASLAARHRRASPVFLGCAFGASLTARTARA